MLNLPWIIKAVPPPEHRVPKLQPQSAEPGGLLQWWYQQTGSFAFLQQWVMQENIKDRSSAEFALSKNSSFQHSCMGEGFLLAEVSASPGNYSTFRESSVNQRQKLLKLLILQTPRKPGDLKLWKFPAADQLWFWRHGFSAASLQLWLRKVRGLSGALVSVGQAIQRFQSFPPSGSFAALGSITLSGKRVLQMPRIRVHYWKETVDGPAISEKCKRSAITIWQFRPFVQPYSTKLGHYPEQTPERLGSPLQNSVHANA